MFRLLGLVISIALADSLNPSTVGPALYLASGRCPRRDVLEFTASTFVVFLVGGVILTVGPGRAILALVPRPGAHTRYILETLAGAAMLIVAAVLWKRRQHLGKRESPSEAQPKRRSPALMGATIAVVELPTAFPYLAAIVAIVGSGLGFVEQLILVGIYNVCFILPLLVIALLVTVAGERAVALLTRARAFLHDHWPVIACVVALAAGVFVITLGVTGLASSAHGRLGRFSRRLRHLIPH
jgi:cytochrome c biogenesis protein CcdA